MNNKETTQLDNSNFLKLIAFGKIDTHVEKTMFLLMDSLYSPFVFSWSASILFLKKKINHKCTKRFFNYGIHINDIVFTKNHIKLIVNIRRDINSVSCMSVVNWS